MTHMRDSAATSAALQQALDEKVAETEALRTALGCRSAEAAASALGDWAEIGPRSGRDRGEIGARSGRDRGEIGVVVRSR